MVFAYLNNKAMNPMLLERIRAFFRLPTAVHNKIIRYIGLGNSQAKPTATQHPNSLFHNAKIDSFHTVLPPIC